MSDQPSQPKPTQSPPELPGLFVAVRLEVRPCLSQILGCVALLTRDFKTSKLEDLLPDLAKVESAAKLFIEEFDQRIDSQGFPIVKPGEDLADTLRTIRHELRTPVGHMVGYSEMLLEEVETSQSHLRSDLERLCRSARQLLNLVNESLEISTAGKSAAPEKESSPLLPSAAPKQFKAEALVCDDNEANRDLLTKYLNRHGISVTTAENGQVALQKMAGASFDVVLLDLMMPVMDGFQVLDYMQKDESLRDTPTIIVSALNEMESVVSCIQKGAADCIHKPINPVLLEARLEACLQKKKLRDQEQHYLAQLEVEQAKSESLLLNILPGPIAARLKRRQNVIADNFGTATVLFADIIHFTDTSSQLTPATLVKSLNLLFTAYDALAERYGVEKIKTIGDAYMAAAGLPIPSEDHAQNLVEMAIEMIAETERIKPQLVYPFEIRVGLATGPVTAGVIGRKKFCYDLWGDTVNIASRLSGVGNIPEVRMTASTFELVRDMYQFRAPEAIELKGKGKVETYVVAGRK